MTKGDCKKTNLIQPCSPYVVESFVFYHFLKQITHSERANPFKMTSIMLNNQEF